jgi:hypothetical protein
MKNCDFRLRIAASGPEGPWGPTPRRDCGLMESLRSINFNGPFDTKAHDRQNSLNLKSKIQNLKLHSTYRGTKMDSKNISVNKH